MVQMLLEKFGGDARNQPLEGDSAPASQSTGQSAAAPEKIVCFHVDCRLSDGVEDIGRMRVGKLARLLKYCAEAIWCRWRYGVSDFFFIPAPGMRSAIYRDWIVMIFCRPFFRRRIYYWQAAGLAEWLRTQAKPWERKITEILLAKPALSIVLAEYGKEDPACLRCARTEVIPNGVPDPCPDYAAKLRPVREARAASRAAALAETPTPAGAPEPARLFYNVLFLSLCIREKGLFDALEAVVLFNRALAAKGARLRARLNVAGKFMSDRERAEFDQRALAPELQWPPPGSNAGPSESLARYCGFVSGRDKERLFRENDCFCFPTYYLAESFGIVLVEAMAFGMNIITTRWRGLPELLPQGYPGMVDPQSPRQIADKLEQFVTAPPNSQLRERFLANYTADLCAERVRSALVSNPPDAPRHNLERDGVTGSSRAALHHPNSVIR